MNLSLFLIRSAPSLILHGGCREDVYSGGGCVCVLGVRGSKAG